MSMMMMALALATQATPLETDPRQAALTCGAAVRATTVGDSPDGVVTITYFSISAAVQNGMEGVLDRSSGETRLMMQRVPTVRANAPALLSQCRQRFPKAFVTGPVKLPADDYDRRIMCSSAAAIVGTYLGKTDPGAGEKLISRFATLVGSDEFEKRGLTDLDGYKKELGRVFRMSLEIGNFNVIVKSCEAAYPA